MNDQHIDSGGGWEWAAVPGQDEVKKKKRPQPMPEPALTYRTEDSIHPDQIRVSFDDGSTAIYDLRTELPHPVMIRNHEIMAKWSNKGYNNQPARRRRRKQ